MFESNLFWNTLKEIHRKHNCDISLTFDDKFKNDFDIFFKKNILFLNKMLKIIIGWTELQPTKFIKIKHFTRELILFYLFMDKDIKWNYNGFITKLHQCISFSYHHSKNFFWHKAKFKFKNQILKLEDDKNLKITKKFKTKAILFGNLIKEFLRFFKIDQNRKNKIHAYYLGYYLSIFVLLHHFYKNKIDLFKIFFEKQKNNQISVTQHQFLLPKLFANINYIKKLKFFFPKKFNYFVININKHCNN